MRKVVAALGLCLAISCAPKVQTTVLMPANHMEASQIKTVTVLPFTLEDGFRRSKESVEFASQVEAAIASVIIDGKPYFKLIDRLTINRVIQEQKFNMSGLVSQDDVAKIGKLVGAKGVYTGVLHPIKKSQESYREERIECRENRCITKYVRCTTRTLIFSFTPRLVDVETGRVVYSRTISIDVEDDGCDDTQPATSFEQLENHAKRMALEEFIRDVAPYYITMELELMDSKDNIQSKEDKEKFGSALDFAEKGRMDRACSMWEEIYESNKNSISLNYNLGICKELSGKPAEALNFYKRADQLTKKPDELINKALKRALELLKRQEKLKKQMGAT